MLKDLAQCCKWFGKVCPNWWLLCPHFFLPRKRFEEMEGVEGTGMGDSSQAESIPMRRMWCLTVTRIHKVHEQLHNFLKWTKIKTDQSVVLKFSKTLRTDLTFVDIQSMTCKTPAQAILLFRCPFHILIFTPHFGSVFRRNYSDFRCISCVSRCWTTSFTYAFWRHHWRATTPLTRVFWSRHKERLWKARALMTSRRATSSAHALWWCHEGQHDWRASLDDVMKNNTHGANGLLTSRRTTFSGVAVLLWW